MLKLTIKLTQRVQIPPRLVCDPKKEEYWEEGELLMLMSRLANGSVLCMTLAGPMEIPAGSYVEIK